MKYYQGIDRRSSNVYVTVVREAAAAKASLAMTLGACAVKDTRVCLPVFRGTLSEALRSSPPVTRDADQER